MTQQWTKGLKHARIDNSFLNYAEKGIIYEYLGLTGFFSYPSAFYQLKRTYNDGFSEELYFEVESGLLRIIKENDSSFRVYHEYKDIGGILYPHVNIRVFDSLTPPHIFIIDKMSVNDHYEDSFFGEFR